MSENAALMREHENEFNDYPNYISSLYICELNMCNSKQYFDILDNPAICSNYCTV